jgi:hypothetical protein
MAYPQATRVFWRDEAVPRPPLEATPTLPDALRDPLDGLRALARQDLSPLERALVEAEIRTWEHHRLLQEWRRESSTPRL